MVNQCLRRILIHCCLKLHHQFCHTGRHQEGPNQDQLFFWCIRLSLSLYQAATAFATYVSENLVRSGPATWILRLSSSDTLVYPNLDMRNLNLALQHMGVVLQRFEFTKVCMGKNINRDHLWNCLAVLSIAILLLNEIFLSICSCNCPLFSSKDIMT